ncbi:MAG: helix-turn-helix transcriptional regulator [Solirubrobacteraceae bacterium]
MTTLVTNHVRAARIALDMTQAELAAAVGISRVALGKIERGQTEEPRRATRRKLVGVLGRTEAELWPAEEPEYDGEVPADVWRRVQAGEVACLLSLGDTFEMEFQEHKSGRVLAKATTEGFFYVAPGGKLVKVPLRRISGRPRARRSKSTRRTKSSASADGEPHQRGPVEGLSTRRAAR